MSSVASLLAIDIGLDPYIVTLGGITLSWLAVFILLGITAGTWVARTAVRAKGVDLDPDSISTLVMVVVASGIVGARLLYALERYGDSESLDSPLELLALNEGGISIYGSLIGGAIGGWAYGLWKRLPCALVADAAGLGMLVGIAVGRIGDVINGEHVSRATTLPWGVEYTHPSSPSYLLGVQHPAVAYEAIGALAIFAVLLLFRARLAPGVTFLLTFLLYAIMRFFVSFFRLDSKEPIAGLSTPQLVSLAVIAVCVPLLIWSVSRVRPARTAIDQASSDPG